MAARHASAPPPNVEPCMPGPSTDAAASVQSTAPIGSPAASGFASAITSGRTPSHASKANASPVRPSPHWTSSRMRSASCLSARSLARVANSFEISTIPPSPRTGSKMMPAVLSSTAASRAAVSPTGMNSTPGSSGANGPLYLGWPVTEIAPSVRPEKDSSSAMMRYFSGLRARPWPLAILSAASTASAPLLQKKVRSRPLSRESRSASSPWLEW